MARALLVPITLPADPVNPLEAVTKQYVDNVVGMAYQFDTSTTTNAAPAGKIRYDNASAGSTGFIGIGKTNANGIDVSAVLSRIARGSILVFRSSTGVVHSFAVQGDPTSFSTCFEWNVNPLSTAGTMTNGALINISTGYDVRYNFLDELADVNTAGATDWYALIYNNTSGNWEAKTPWRTGTYTPTWSGITQGTGGNAVNTASWRWSGGWIDIEGTFRTGTSGFVAPGATLTCTAPPGMVWGEGTYVTGQRACGTAVALNNAASASGEMIIAMQTTTSMRFVGSNAAGANTTRAATSSTVPITWDAGSYILWTVRARASEPT